MADPVPPLTPADRAALLASLRYALRFDDRGKPLGKTYRNDADLMAEWLARHLERSRYVVMRRTAPGGSPRPG